MTCSNGHCPACGSVGKEERRRVELPKLYGVLVWEQLCWVCECGYLWASEQQREHNQKASRNAIRVR